MPLLNISPGDGVDCDDADVEDVADVGNDAIGGMMAGLRHAKVPQCLAYVRLKRN
jgi:hypothetical protein